MIPKECKRLAEVDFPIAVVSKHAMREKSIRHGHPSTLHLWWARRPLASCRAMLLALLLPDPCDEHCPGDFKEKARGLLPPTVGPVGPKDEDLRAKLLKFIGDFANWDLSADPTWLSVARGLVKAAHPEETPLVVDPFAGGGSIPLEALRVGCDAFASDLNPVACLILKVMLEDIPRHGPDLADELRRLGAEIKAAAEKELNEFYPTDPDGARPIAYLWARTVRCESPNCGAEIPLIRSFWLSKKRDRRTALRYKPVSPQSGAPRIEFEIFQPTTDSEVAQGTVTRAKGRCVCCGTVLSPARVRAQLSSQRGGADVIFDETGERIGGARLLAIVTLKPGEQGRQYRLPAARDYKPVWNAVKLADKLTASGVKDGLSEVPDEPTPKGGGSGASRAFSVYNYGMTRWGDLFTARQKLSMIHVAAVLRGSSKKGISPEGLALAQSRWADIFNSLCRWENTKTQVRNLFTRPALPIVWDFAETSVFGQQAGDPTTTIKTMARVIDSFAGASHAGHVERLDAAAPSLPEDSCTVWFTDPPYYDAIPYAALSDFFFVWLKRVIPSHPLITMGSENGLTPKAEEAVQDETRVAGNRPKDRDFFEERMATAFAAGRRTTREDGVGGVVFAHKTTEVVRRFAQPLGIRLPDWDRRIIETQKGRGAASAGRGAGEAALRRVRRQRPRRRDRVQSARGGAAHTISRRAARRPRSRPSARESRDRHRRRAGKLA